MIDWAKEGNLKQVDRILSSISTAAPATELAVSSVVDEDGQTALHWACDRGHLDIVERLLAAEPGCVDRVDGFGQTALHLGK